MKIRRRCLFLFFLLISFIKIPSVLAEGYDFIGFPTSQDGTNSWYISNAMGGNYLLGDKWLIGHLGDDFVAKEGTPLYAVSNSVVHLKKDWPKCSYAEDVCTIDSLGQQNCIVKKVNNHGWGPVVVLKHDISPNNFKIEDTFLAGSEIEENPKIIFIHYGHLDSVASLEEGQQVTKGQKIAEVGKVCGYWPHLHFEIKDTFAIQTELHDGVGVGYSSINGIVNHHYSPSKFIELNKNLVLAEEKEEPEKQENPKSNLFSFLKKSFDIFSIFLTKKDANIKGEKVPASAEATADKEDQSQSNYNAQIFNPSEKFIVLPGQEIKIQISAKNTGTTTWLQKNVSINVVGGETANIQFKHPSWLTNLRTTRLDQAEVNSGETGTFSFSITAPQTLGNHNFKSFLVLQNGSNFTSIGTDVYTAQLTVVEKIEVEQKPEISSQEIIQKNSFTDVLGEKIKKGTDSAEQIVDTIIDTIKKVPELISKLKLPSGGGGGGTLSPVPGTVEDTTTTTATTTTPSITTPSVPTTTPAMTSSTDATTTGDVELEDVASETLDLWISLISPETFPFVTSGTSTTISGNKSQDVEIIYFNDDAIDSSEFTTTTWQYIALLEEGSNMFEFFVTDTQGNATSTVSVEIIRDSSAPTIPEVIISQATFASPTMSIAWSGDAGSYVDIQLKQSKDVEWTNLFELTTSTQMILEVERYLSYEVRARSRDEVGNYSNWSEPVSLTIDWPKTLVLHEVSWIGVGSGNNSCKNPEWIELYNTTNHVLDLSGWNLQVNSKNTSFSIPLSGTLEAHAYYLIENIDKVINNFSADALFPKNTKLEDTGATLTIRDAIGEIIDTTDQQSGWFSGGLIGDKYVSMERVDVAEPGNSVSNWRHAQYRHYGIASDCKNPVYGSPRLASDKNVLLPNNISQVYDFGEDKILVLTTQDTPYIFDSEVSIPVGYTLRIEPGVVLLGVNENSGFKVEGTFEIIGTENESVILSSRDDVEHGEWCNDPYLSTFCDGTTAPGAWKMIRVLSGGTLTMQNTKLYYAGAKYKYGTCSSCYVSQAIRNEGGTVSILGSTISDSYALANTHSSDAFVYASGGTLTITDSHFSQGCRALAVQDGAMVSVDATTFSEFNLTCTYPVVLNAIFPAVWSENVLSGNISDAVYLPSFTVDHDISFDSNTSFAFASLEVPAPYTLSAQAGSHILLEKNGLIRVYGNLNFDGTADNPVQVIPGASGGFGGIFVSGGTANFSHVEINGGGYFSNQNSYPMQSNESNVLWFENTQVVMKDLSISNSRRPGGTILAKDSSLSIVESTFGWDEPYDKLDTWFDNGITVQNSTLHIDHVNFKKMNTAVSVYDGSTFTYENFGIENFIDPYHTQYKNWQPADLLDFDLWNSEEGSVEEVEAEAQE